MASITINNEQLEKSFSSKETLQDVLDDVLSLKENESKVVSAIKVDGKILSPDEEDEALINNLDQFENVEFVLQSSIDLAFEALDSCSLYIDNITGKISALTELYSDNKQDMANEAFADVIDTIDLFVQLVSRIHKTLRLHYQDKFTKSETFQNLEIHLLSILKALIPAKQKNDLIMLNDLLEYELIDNLTQWKIQAIPELKKLKDI
jgi:hypothetical protein